MKARILNADTHEYTDYFEVNGFFCAKRFNGNDGKMYEAPLIHFANFHVDGTCTLAFREDTIHEIKENDLWIYKAPELTEWERRIIETAQDYENAFAKADRTT